MNNDLTHLDQLTKDVEQLIKLTQQKVAAQVNQSLVILYWSIGERINKDILKESRAEYGKNIIEQLAKSLTEKYGRGYSSRNLFRMAKFSKYFTDKKIVSTLSAQLSWSHFQELLGVSDALQREFYAEMSRTERWGVRALRAKIGGKLFERTPISKKPKNLIQSEINQLRDQNIISPLMVFKDPYVLDFLELDREYSEKDLENAILNEIIKFIRELGSDFCLVDRQKRMMIGTDDYYLDLLFFHRKLRRLIAIDLKLDRFKPMHKAQMELYLNWLNTYEKHPEEKPPLGIIMCADKKQELIELLELDKSGIHVAQYVTELKPLRHLENRLHHMLEIARDKIK